MFIDVYFNPCCFVVCLCPTIIESAALSLEFIDLVLTLFCLQTLCSPKWFTIVDSYHTTLALTTGPSPHSYQLAIPMAIPTAIPMG